MGTVSDAREASLDPLIGRDVEVAAVLDGLQASRLVCLYGPGGSGKTRIAAAVVADATERGIDAWFVDASTLTDTQFLLPTVLTALDLKEPGSRDPLAAIATRLAASEVWIALDNLEQLAGSGEVVIALLEACPLLRVVATSRIPLGVAGEVALAVPPLRLPDDETAAAVSESAAGRLFLARRRAAGHLHQVADGEGADIAALLKRLDGLPLAIELAAARTRILTPRELVEMLDEFGVASIDAADGGHHRSLAAILDWTLGLLSPRDWRALQAVAICAGFDVRLGRELLESATASVDTLVSVGLIQPTFSDARPTRYRVLETIRREVIRRTAADELERLRGRHASAMSSLADAHATDLEGGDPDVRERFEIECDNFRLALEHLTAAEPRHALRLWHQLHPVWESNSRLAEGRDRLYTAAARVSEDAPELARALARHAMNAELLGESGRAVAQRALAVAQRASATSAEIEALLVLGVTALNDGDVDLARALMGDLEHAVEDSDTYEARVDEMRYMLAATIHGPASDEAFGYLTAALERARLHGRKQQEIALSGNLASVYLHRDDARSAVAAAERAVALARNLGSRLLPWAIGWLVYALAESGEIDKAADKFGELVDETLELGSPLQVFDSLLFALPVALGTNQPLFAARIWGTAMAMLDRGDADLPRDDRVLAERILAKSRRQAAEIEFELAVREGRNLDPAEVLRSLPSLFQQSAVSNRSSRLRHGELTPREVEILGLVGRGQSDAEIAASLFISPKTASVHISNVKAKLGARSRVELALRARELGL